MLIDQFTKNGSADATRVAARIRWEDTDRSPLTLYAEIPRRFSSGWTSDPNAFLVASLLPAWNAGERRIVVDGSVCPILLDHLGMVARLLQSWYPELGPAPEIDVKETNVRAPDSREACAFLSCGIDSLSTLRRNRLLYPASHPMAIKAGLTAHFVKADRAADGLSRTKTESTRRKCAAIAADMDIDAIPVATNVKDLEPNGYVYVFKWHGAVFSFLAHLFSGRFSTAFLASSYDVANLEPWGSHPLLDNGFGAAHLQVAHDGHGHSRFEKTATVAGWPVALDALQVCQSAANSGRNCGTCEKCIRTQTALAALGRLESAAAFDQSDVSAELLRTVIDYDMLYNDSQANYYVEMREPLAAAGREDLVQVIDEINRYYDAKRERVLKLGETVSALVGPDQPFALARDHLYGGSVVPARGHNWGQPSGGDAAVRQLDSLRKTGHRCIVLPADGWWLDRYQGLRERLDGLCRRKVAKEGMLVYWI